MKPFAVALAVSAFTFMGSAFAAVPDVDFLESAPNNSFVTLSWKSPEIGTGAAISGYNIYYGTASAATTNGVYSKQIETKNTKTVGTVPGLINGTPYFFAVTAVFADGTESPNYSPEVSATPAAPTASGTTTPIASPFSVVSAMAPTSTTVSIFFSEEISLPEASPETAFSISDAKTMMPLIVLSAEIDPNNPKTAIIQTSTQEPKTAYVVTISTRIQNKTGAPIVSGSLDTALFYGSGTEESASVPATDEPMHSAATTETGATTDTTPPEDATGFRASFSSFIDSFLVRFGWTPSKNSTGDLASQRLYEAQNGGEYGKAEVLGKEVASHQKSLAVGQYAGKEMTYRLTQIDESGNESTGAITTIKLPETGPALVWALAALGSAIAAAAIRRRNN